MQRPVDALYAQEHPDAASADAPLVEHNTPPVPPRLTGASVRIGGWSRARYAIFHWQDRSGPAAATDFLYAVVPAERRVTPHWHQTARSWLALSSVPDGRWLLLVRAVSASGLIPRIAPCGRLPWRGMYRRRAWPPPSPADGAGSDLAGYGCALDGRIGSSSSSRLPVSGASRRSAADYTAVLDLDRDPRLDAAWRCPTAPGVCRCAPSTGWGTAHPR